ncbi:MAG: bifunctional methylenetetrahydrofolate dehydrogenase/methenyltetrahydrofolate cyclohydrolase FolD [Proteobacteria bacterium]|nr:bifunctional methylenetetrahydrofolate dehydrogenase/methenyltetrahydrofolate cyclohydrolase FolD [Pseudomonadota bacterium]
MSAVLLDGKALAAKLREDIGWEVQKLKQERNIVPGLGVVLVGNNPASEVYVRNKEKAVKDADMASFPHHLPATTTQAELLRVIYDMNRNEKVHGILVQLPLPKGINAETVLEAVDPAKDVDGFHPLNAGKLAIGRPTLVPCTPQGCIHLIKQAKEDLTGLHAVVVGRSNIVGKPVAQLLLAENCTVTIAHSKTRDLNLMCKRADILVAAVGQPEMIRGDWVKPGAIVIDVGINRVEAGEGKTRLVGDVDFENAREIAGFITPVPGGVGPMTIACLLQNTLKAASN